MSLRKALDRTLLLMRDDVVDAVTDALLLDALTGTTVVLLADERNISTHAAQTAFVTAAMLLARSGHQVFLRAPDISLIGEQPPLKPGRMISSLMEVGGDLIPGVEFCTNLPAADADIAVAFGNTPFAGNAHRRLRLNATAWSGRLDPEDASADWLENDWPMGAMAAGALVAGEAFKLAMRKLGRFFRNPDRLHTTFADSVRISFDLAPAETPRIGEVGQVDFVSGGAITNAILYALARIPGVRGSGRVIEPDIAEITNLNRYVLLRRSALGGYKARDLASICPRGISLEPIVRKFDSSFVSTAGPLAPSVLLGVDHIPSRWDVQRAHPQWLGIGATTHWSLLASHHLPEMGCAQCLHPTDDPTIADIPTVAFVSFMGGLLVAAYFLRHAAGENVPLAQQCVYVTPLRPEAPFWAAVTKRDHCPTCGNNIEEAPRGLAA